MGPRNIVIGRWTVVDKVTGEPMGQDICYQGMFRFMNHVQMLDLQRHFDPMTKEFQTLCKNADEYSFEATLIPDGFVACPYPPLDSSHYLQYSPFSALPSRRLVEIDGRCP